MLEQFKAATFKAKLGYISLVIAVLLGVSNVGEKVWASLIKFDAKYAKQVALDETNKRLYAMERKYDKDKLLQIDKQLFDMKMRWGADMSKWTEDQRTFYFEKKAELEKLKEKLKKK